MADQIPPHPISTSDHPFPPQHPESSSNTVLSAPTTTTAAAAPGTAAPADVDQSALTPAPEATPTSAPASASASTSAARRPPRQIAGSRRRRSPEDEEDYEAARPGPAAVGSSAAGGATTTRSRAKRMRTEMLALSDGEASSNGTARAASNGTGTQQRTPLATSANGTHKMAAAGAMNGSSSHNGKEVARPPAAADYMGNDREEVTRILIQALSDMGYQDAAESVSRESGYALESRTVANFRKSVLGGAWAEAERLLMGAAPAPDDKTTPGNDLVLVPGADRDLMRFWLRRQKFLELLEQRNTARALTVLRTELSTLYQDTSKVHFLSALLMCQSPEEVKAKANWDGAHGLSRQLLLTDLSSAPPRLSPLPMNVCAFC